MYPGDIAGMVLASIWMVSVIIGAITYPFWLKAEQKARNGASLEDGYRRAYWTTLIIIGPFALISFAFSFTDARKQGHLTFELDGVSDDEKDDG